jgi:hypothetical protein
MDGVNQPLVSGVNSSPYIIQGTAPNVYTLVSVTDNSGCDGVVSGSANVDAYSGLPIGQDDTFISPGTAQLSVIDEGGVYEWYDAPVGGNRVDNGGVAGTPNFTTPTLSSQTSYYVQNTGISALVTKNTSYCSRVLGFYGKCQLYFE